MVVHSLMQSEYVKNVKPVSPTQLTISVSEAGSAIPALMELLEANNCSVTRIRNTGRASTRSSLS